MPLKDLIASIEASFGVSWTNLVASPSLERRGYFQCTIVAGGYSTPTGISFNSGLTGLGLPPSFSKKGSVSNKLYTVVIRTDLMHNNRLKLTAPSVHTSCAVGLPGKKHAPMPAA